MLTGMLGHGIWLVEEGTQPQLIICDSGRQESELSEPTRIPCLKCHIPRNQHPRLDHASFVLTLINLNVGSTLLNITPSRKLNHESTGRGRVRFHHVGWPARYCARTGLIGSAQTCRLADSSKCRTASTSTRRTMERPSSLPSLLRSRDSATSGRHCQYLMTPQTAHR
jgi:hypothetical protein